MDPIIVPALIASSQLELDRALERLKGHAKRIMLDVMDGIFVENTSLNFEFKLEPGFEYEAHLMVSKPLETVESIDPRVNSAILHIETLNDIAGAIKHVKEKGLKAVLALNPPSDIDNILPHLGEIDGVLVMTVIPGGYGGRFLPSALNKVRRIREINKEIPVEVDGGINLETVGDAYRAGANIFASGSFILKSKDISRAILDLKLEILKKKNNTINYANRLEEY
jgi:ribulose-phosphate 3-epimerase